MLTTTFALLKSAGACAPRYQHLAKALGGITTYGPDTPIPLLRIVDTNGLDDALWALCAVPEHEQPLRDRLARLFACDCAERVLPIFERMSPGEARPREAVTVARRYAAGQATSTELAAALAAAWAAALAAAWDAARDAVLAAARYAAWVAACDAACDAARAAAWDAAWAAARHAVLAAARDAAWAAARYAAARYAAARAAETSWQTARFRELLTGDEVGAAITEQAAQTA